MLGFVAEALSDEITIDPEELDDAKWFTLDQISKAVDWFPGENLAAAGDGKLRLPSRDSIARRLIDDWYGEQS